MGSTDRNCHYKSVATQTPRDAWAGAGFIYYPKVPEPVGFTSKCMKRYAHRSGSRGYDADEHTTVGTNLYEQVKTENSSVLYCQFGILFMRK